MARELQDTREADDNTQKRERKRKLRIRKAKEKNEGREEI